MVTDMHACSSWCSRACIMVVFPQAKGHFPKNMLCLGLQMQTLGTDML